MSFTKKILIQIILLFIFNHSIEGRELPTAKFSNITIKDGLSSGMVYQTLQDNLGYIWMATASGLNRYDGKNFKLFAQDPNSENSISQDHIKVIYQDTKGYLWIGTQVGGLNRYDFNTATFTTFLYDSNDPTTISSNEILSIHEDSKGNLWIGTERGLNHFDYETEQFHAFLDTEANSISSNAVLSILEDSKGRLWLGTWNGGLNLGIPAKSGKIEDMTFRFWRNTEEDPRSVGANHVWCLFEDNQQRLWVGTFNGGLNLMIPNTEQDLNRIEPKFIRYQYDIDDKKSISSNVIFSINQDKNNFLWIGTEYGVCVTDISEIGVSDKLDFRRFVNSKVNKKSLVNNQVRDILIDKLGGVWCSTFGGISHYGSIMTEFDSYLTEREDRGKFTVQSMLADDSRYHWIGTNERGLVKYDRKKDVYQEYTHNPRDPFSINNNHIYALTRDKSGSIWAGTPFGISNFTPSTGKFINYLLTPPEGVVLESALVRKILIDSKERMWLATGAGVVRVEMKTMTFHFYRPDKTKKGRLSHNDVFDIIEEDDGTFWIATFGGLNRMVVDENNDAVFTTYVNDPTNPNSICSNRIINIKKLRNELWIGTEDGLSCFLPEKEHFVNFTSIHGLKNTSIMSFLFDDDDIIWGGTREGLFKFDPKAKKFIHYDVDNGLQDNYFSHNAAYKGDEARLFFGGNNGYNGFVSDEITQNPNIPNILITNFEVYHKEKQFKKDLSLIKEIKLNHKENYFTIFFASLNYDQPDKNQFAYQLEGFDEDWVYSGNRNFASYSNLDGGTYTFRVKGSNNDNLWNEEGKVIKIIIKPPYWKTWWFRGLTVLLLTLAVVGVYRYRLNEIERKQVRLERLVNERTKEVAVEKDKVEGLLVEIKGKNEQLVAQSRELKSTNIDLRRSNKELEQFAYAASHDLQEPLRMVGNFAELLEEEYEERLEDDGKMYISYIVGGVKRMSKLIDDVLTFSKVGRKEMPVEPVNIRDIIEQKLVDLSIRIKDKNGEIILKELPEHLVCEPQQIGIVFHNLVGNGLKFNDNPKPRVTIQAEDKGSEWQFEISDNGIGIDAKNQKRIFEIFKRLHRKEIYDGTGIGLALCKRIVLRHGGNIWVDSALGEGSTFYFTIPKREVEKQQ